MAAKRSDPRTWDINNSKYSWLKGWGFSLKVGIAHMAKRHTDYHCEDRSFAGILYRAAASQGLKCTLAVFEGFVIFTFYKPTALVRPNLQAYPVVRAFRDRNE